MSSAEPTCGCPGCEAGLSPFTLDHFRAWAAALTLDNGEPWIVEPYFELFLEDYFDGVPENWLLVPEGNAKTTSLAGLGVYCLEHRPQAQIPWAASARDQAEIGYRQAEGLVLRSTRLKAFMKCQEGYRRIKNTTTGGRLQVFAADERTGDGVIPTDAFLDELHRHKNLRLYRTWRGKLEKRNGQIAAISTAAEPGSEFEETRERIRTDTPTVEKRPGFIRCRSAEISLHEYAVPAGGNVEDMAVVKLANPFTAITEERLAAKRATPTMTSPHWRRFVCNLATRSFAAAIEEGEWDGAQVDIEEFPEDETCLLGLDVAWKWDTTAAVPMIVGSDYRVIGPCEILVPPRDGRMLDGTLVEDALYRLHERNPIETVVMDVKDAEQLARWIETELGCDVVDRAQSASMAVLDYSRFMEALKDGTLRHTGDPTLRRHVLNAVAKMLQHGDSRFARPSDSRRDVAQQDTRVIDALVAAAMVNSYAVAEYSGRDFVFEMFDPFG